MKNQIEKFLLKNIATNIFKNPFVLILYSYIDLLNKNISQ